MHRSGPVEFSFTGIVGFVCKRYRWESVTRRDGAVEHEYRIETTHSYIQQVRVRTIVYNNTQHNIESGKTIHHDLYSTTKR